MRPQTLMYVLTDASANNNKFWEISIDAEGQVSSRNGRVGSDGQSRTLGTGDALFLAKVREKERKGYRRIDIVGKSRDPGANLNGAALVTAVETQIGKGDPVVTDLVRQLAQINRHQILAASGGQMTLDLATGIISTPLGVVTLENLRSARTILQDLEPFLSRGDLDNAGFLAHLEKYLMLVPQKVGARRVWHRDVIVGMEGLTRQGALLDQLEASIEVAEQRISDAKNSIAKPGSPDPVFDVRIEVLEDRALRARIDTFFAAGRHRQHASAALRISRVFGVTIGTMARDYADDGARIGGTMELWHGTRAHNLISILKSGLIVPRQNGSIHVTGRMFGNGLYFSDQSTKSLNYAHGYWDGEARDRTCYMFLADVAMGRPWHPDRTGSNVRPPAGHDSVFARGGKDRVLNNEMIVYRTSQVNLRYLVEFRA